MRHKAQISQMFTIVWDNHREYFTLIKVSSLLVFGRITFCHLPFQSKWLYVGTERGNIHMVNVESFTLSGYVIMWNKAIELWVSRHRELQWFSCVFFYCWVWEILIKGLVYKYLHKVIMNDLCIPPSKYFPLFNSSSKTHPGPVVHISDNPMDEGKVWNLDPLDQIYSLKLSVCTISEKVGFFFAAFNWFWVWHSCAVGLEIEEGWLSVQLWWGETNVIVGHWPVAILTGCSFHFGPNLEHCYSHSVNSLKGRKVSSRDGTYSKFSDVTVVIDHKSTTIIACYSL